MKDYGTKETLQIKNEQGNMWRMRRYRRIFGIDPTIVRLLCVLLGCTSTGVILYIIAAIIMPEEY